MISNIAQDYADLVQHSFLGKFSDQLRQAQQIRSNMDIEQLHEERIIINTIKIRRMQCLGYLIRMRDDRSPKNISNGLCKYYE